MNSQTTDASFNGENNICRKEEIINESMENVPKKFMLLSSKLYSVYLAQTHTHTHSHSHSASVFKNSKLNCDHNNRKIMPHQINRTHRPQKNSILFSKTLISSNQFKEMMYTLLKSREFNYAEDSSPFTLHRSRSRNRCFLGLIISIFQGEFFFLAEFSRNAQINEELITQFIQL